MLSSKFLTRFSNSSAFSAVRKASLKTTLYAFSENWYIGFILHISLRMKYNIEALVAARL